MILPEVICISLNPKRRHPVGASSFGAGDRDRVSFSLVAKIEDARRRAVARNSPPDCCI